MATHCGILPWRISGTEESGRLQSMGSQRAGHDGATNTFTTLIQSNSKQEGEETAAQSKPKSSPNRGSSVLPFLL